VILDVVTEDPQWGEWSSSMIARCAEGGMLVINPIVYAEVSIGFERIEELDEVLPADSFRRDPLPWEAAFLQASASSDIAGAEAPAARLCRTFTSAPTRRF
jgi:hypothetical protein